MALVHAYASAPGIPDALRICRICSSYNKKLSGISFVANRLSSEGIL